MIPMVWSRALLPALVLLLAPLLSRAEIGVSISVDLAPPPLPVYPQPPLPAEGYLWIPGYWAWNPAYGYYWVPGTWVLAPEPGFLWTPGYWGFVGGVYWWHAGYWGPHVGFYGGVNYGCGYGGHGYDGGYWQGRHLYYNRSVTNISNTTIANVYNRTVVNNTTVNRVSYHGGTGGVQAQPTSAETAAAQERHLAPTATQQRHVQLAGSNPALRASANHGNPPIAATARPAVFSGSGVVPARHAATATQPASAAHPAPAQPGYHPAPAPAERRAPPAPAHSEPHPGGHPQEHEHDRG